MTTSAAFTACSTRVRSKRSASWPATPENSTNGRMNRPPARLASSCAIEARVVRGLVGGGEHHHVPQQVVVAGPERLRAERTAGSAARAASRTGPIRPCVRRSLRAATPGERIRASRARRVAPRSCQAAAPGRDASPPALSSTRATACTVAAMRTALCTASRVQPVLAQLPLVRGDAGAAAVDGRDRERQQLEVRLGDAGAADDVHAQARRQLRVLRVLHQVQEAVVDVVHAP